MELKLNQAVLFKNTKKQAGTKQPDYLGSINIEGEIRDLAMWARKSEKGVVYLLGNNAPPYIKPEEEKKPQQSHEYKQQKSGKEENLPF